MDESGLRWRKIVGFTFTLATSAGAFGLFAIQGILLARFLGPDQRGAFAATGLYPQALLYLGMLGATELFAGYASGHHADGPLRRAAARYGLATGIFTTAICIALAWITLPTEFRWVFPWAVVTALTVPLQQIRLAVCAVDHGQRHFTRYNAIRLASAAAFPILLSIGSLFIKIDFQVACWLFIAAQVISLALVQLTMNESWLGPASIDISSALRQARGLIGSWLTAEILERADMVLVLLLVANQETMGFYAAAVPIASVMIILPNTAGLYAFNRGARAGEHLTSHEVWRFLGVGLALQIVFALLLAAALPLVIPWLYGESFQSTVAYAWALLPAGIFRGLLQACDSYVRARQQSSIGIKARAISIPILLLFSLLTVSRLGALAIPIGLSLAQGVSFIIMAQAIVRDSQTSKTQLPT